MIDYPAVEKKSSAAAALLWAVFLGSSWTWVIGMFLPVLLVRDYGWLGWAVFAIPNVLGAAAMGWVLRDADASARFVSRHRGACQAFSIVTIAYHVFFAMWMIERLRGWGWIAVGVLVVATLLPARDESRWAMAMMATAASLAMWWMLHRQGMLAFPPLAARRHAGESPMAALLLLPAFMLGFSLCPYLDLTFHRARQSTSPAGGRFAFAVGFGIVFFAMIVFTLMYARWLAPAVDGQPLGKLTTMFLCIHLLGQSTFTVAIHARELPIAAVFADDGKARLAAIGAMLLFAGALWIGWITSKPRVLREHDSGEIVYWCFLGFYGLIFPAYLWLNGFAGRATASHHDKRRLRALLALTVAAALPAYWMAFIERKPVWLLAGVGIMLASRLVARRSAK